MAKSANTKKRAAPKTAWKPGQSGNPNGRPRDGESWASVLTWAANLTGDEAAALVPPEMARHFKPLRGRKLKEMISLRVFAALLFEPSPALFKAVAERMEGMVPQEIKVDWREEAKARGYDPDELVEQFATAMVSAAIRGSGAPATDEADEHADA